MSDSVENQQRSGVPGWAKWVVLGTIAAVVVFFGAIFLYAKVLNDSPDKLDSTDLDTALAADPPAATDDAGTDVATDDAPVPTDVEPSATDSVTESADDSSEVAGRSGSWSATADSTVGYRVVEVLFGVDTEGVGRTNVVDGTLVIEGTTVTSTEFTVDVATIESDDDRRDRQFRGRIMSVDEFPTASFSLTEPIELGTEAVDGAEVAVQATGDLTLRGVTNSVTFDLTAKLDNGKVGVLGEIPVVFADYGIANPSTAGITTQDHGLLEFILVFEPA